jgi:hypothetical protein
MRTGTNETETILAFSEFTETGAEITLQPTVIEPVPVSSGNSANISLFRGYCLLPVHCNDMGVTTPGRNGPMTVFLRM